MLNDRRKIHLYITIAVMVFIFVQSAMPGKISSGESNFIVRIIVALTGLPAPPLKLFVRKTAHFLEYLVLGACLLVNVRDWEHGRGLSTFDWRCWVLPWLIGTIYAVTDEIHQIFVPRRACAFTDMCIDSAGAAVGVALMMLIMYMRRKEN